MVAPNRANTPVDPHKVKQEWRDRILEELGGEGVDSELTNRQLDKALKSALELWDRFRPVRIRFPFDVGSGETIRISFFNDIERRSAKEYPGEFVMRVLDVEFSDSNRRVLGPRAGFLEGYHMRWGYEGPRLFFQLHTAQRNYERLTGSRPDWYYDCDSRELYVHAPGRDLRCMVLATKNNTLSTISYDNVSRFLQAATAKAKYALARTLGSRGVIRGAGGEITTDAAELRSESKEEWKEVETALETSMASWCRPRYIG